MQDPADEFAWTELDGALCILWLPGWLLLRAVSRDARGGRLEESWLDLPEIA